MSDELKPCPFCGSHSVEDESTYYAQWATCNKCGAKAPNWNTRAQLSAQSVSAVQPVIGIEGCVATDFQRDCEWAESVLQPTDPRRQQAGEAINKFFSSADNQDGTFAFDPYDARDVDLLIDAVSPAFIPGDT